MIEIFAAIVGDKIPTEKEFVRTLEPRSIECNTYLFHLAM